MSRVSMLIFLALTPIFAKAQLWDTNQKLPIYGEESYNGFGNSLAISGDRIIAGFNREYFNNGSDSFDVVGGVYSYKITKMGKWELEQEIFNPDPKYYRYFGAEVAVLDKKAIVSSHAVSDTTRPCSRYSLILEENLFVYAKDSVSNWLLKQRLKANDAADGDGFGTSLEMHDKFLFVGAPLEDQDSPGGSGTKNKGSVYLFEDSNGVYVQKEKIFPVNSTKYTNFGNTISVSGEYMWVGTFYSNNAFVFKRDSMGRWIEYQHITSPSNINKNINFGENVEVHGNHAVVTAPLDNVDSFWSAGSVYLYRIDTTGQWVEHQRLFAPAPNNYMYYGNDIALSDSLLVVGMKHDDVLDSLGNWYNRSGAAYVYRLNHANEWVLIRKLTTDTLTDYSFFGSDICADNEHIVVGAEGAGEMINCKSDWTQVPGKTYVYSRCSTTFKMIEVTTCSEYLTPSGKRILRNDGIYYDTLTSINGCDSIIGIDLTILPTYSDTVYAELCAGGSYEFNGRWLNSSGLYQDTLMTTRGCDSMITLSLLETPPLLSSVDTVICTGEPIPQNTVDTFTTLEGCDSIRLYTVFIRNGAWISSSNDTIFAEENRDSYQWLDCYDGLKPIPGEDNGYFIPSESGSYAVIIMDGMCIDTSDCYDITLTQAKSIESNFKVHAYPNPTINKVIFDFGPEVQDVNCNIFNSLGKLIDRRSFNSTSKFEISLPEISGVYYVHLLTGGTRKVFRIIKI